VISKNMQDINTKKQEQNINSKPAVKHPVSEIEEGKQLLDVIAPDHVEVDFNHIKVNNVYYRTLFIGGYPRFVAPGWLEPVINFNSSLDKINSNVTVNSEVV